MKLDDVVKVLEAEVIHRGRLHGDDGVRHVVASDLMSDVLVVDRSAFLLVTSLASDQVIRTADIVGALAVAVVNGKTLPAPMKTLARDLDVSLLRANLSKFDACVRLGHALDAEASAAR